MSLEEDSKGSGKTGRAARVVSFIMLVAVMLFIAYLVYLKSNNIDLRSINMKEVFSSGSLFQVPGKDSSEVVQNEYNPKDHPVFTVYKGNIVKCIDDNIKYLDRNGETVWEKTITASDPIVKTNGNELMVTGTGSKEVYLIKDREIKWSYKFDSSIINANLSEDGYVAVVHEAKGFKGAATVFNLQGTPFFTRNIAEGFIISAGVSSKAKLVAINSLDTGGVNSISNIELTDMLGKPIASKIQIDDSLFPSVWYLKDESVVAVSDSKVVYISRDGKIKWEAPFEDEEILSSAIMEDKSIIVALNSLSNGGILSGSSSKLVLLSGEGKQTDILSVDGTVKNITIFDDVIAVNTGSQVSFTNSKGRLLGKYSPKIDVNEVKFLNGNEAVVITKNSIDIVKVQ